MRALEYGNVFILDFLGHRELTKPQLREYISSYNKRSRLENASANAAGTCVPGGHPPPRATRCGPAPARRTGSAGPEDSSVKFARGGLIDGQLQR
eukprot:2026493-Pleurochrysis_carterae.AAC.1